MKRIVAWTCVSFLLAACATPGGMTRRSINPVQWGLAFHMDQGELVRGATEILHMSGQTDLVVDENAELGLAVGHPGDMRAQMQASLAGIDAVLAEAGMGRANIVSLRFFTTDIAACLQNYDVYAQWIEPAGTRPPQSMIGVAALVMPELLVEIEAVAAR